MECIDSVNADSIDMVDALQSLPLVEGEYSDVTSEGRGEKSSKFENLKFSKGVLWTILSLKISILNYGVH
jgi:hypothetical protein